MRRKKQTKRRARKRRFTAEELQLAAEGKMRLPKRDIGVDEIFKIPTGRVHGNAAVEALLADRDEDR